MSENKKSKESKTQKKNEKKHVNPDLRKGAIEFPDTRERRDGPGGN